MSQIEDSLHEITKEIMKLEKKGWTMNESLEAIKVAILNNISKDTSTIATSLSAMSFKDRINTEDW